MQEGAKLCNHPPVLVRMLYFAAARDRAEGLSEEAYDLPRDADLASLVEAAAQRHPRLADMTRWARFAVNQEFAAPDRVLSDGDEVAVIPPVAGG